MIKFYKNKKTPIIFTIIGVLDIDQHKKGKLGFVKYKYIEFSKNLIYYKKKLIFYLFG